MFALATAAAFFPVWQEGAAQGVPMRAVQTGAEAGYGYLSQSDQIYVAWQVSRNAQTLVEAPLALFDSRMCHPGESVLALGEPMIAMGVLGVPGWLASGDPLVTYNVSLLLLTLLSAFGMYWLVRDWSGVPAAGIVAGLLYAFHPGKFAEVIHPYADDTVWVVFALGFARRWFEGGRARDAIAAAACAVMQAATSFYPFAAAAFMAIPLLVWMAIAYGLAKLRPAVVVAAVATFAGGLAIVYGPYLAHHATTQLADATVHLYGTFGMFRPGEPGFPGALSLLLIAAALGLGRERALRIAGDPRLALLAGALLVGVVCVSTGSGLKAPPVYAWLAEHVPGFDSVRRPYKMLSGIHVALTILAGLGAAALLRCVPARHRVVASAAAIGLALGCVALPGPFGLGHRIVFQHFAIAPDDDALAFYRALAERDDDGPLLEIPIGSLRHNADRVLLTGYHGRRTSACVNANSAYEQEMIRLAMTIASPASLARARELGFTTIVVHHPPGSARHEKLRERVVEAASQPANGLRRLFETPERSAYALGPAG